MSGWTELPVKKNRNGRTKILVVEANMSRFKFWKGA